MNAKEAIAYLRSVTTNDPKAKEALDVLEDIDEIADDEEEIHEAEEKKE